MRCRPNNRPLMPAQPRLPRRLPAKSPLRHLLSTMLPHPPLLYHRALSSLSLLRPRTLMFLLMTMMFNHPLLRELGNTRTQIKLH